MHTFIIMCSHTNIQTYINIYHSLSIQAHTYSIIGTCVDWGTNVIYEYFEKSFIIQILLNRKN